MPGMVLSISMAVRNGSTFALTSSSMRGKAASKASI